MRFAALAILVVALALAGCRPSWTSAGPRLATTTTYLEAAARDLLGDRLEVVRLAQPGTCPGHFDLRPSQVAELRRCRALLRFDFQKSLDARLAGTTEDGPRIVSVAVAGGMGNPRSYLDACRQIADPLVALGLLAPTNAETRLAAISGRIEAAARAATNRIAQAGLVGAPAIASGHQRDFCAWLGLDVVATFRPADTASVREIEEAIAAGNLGQVRLIVANLPEGRRTADALADRLEARVAVFENFPTLRGDGVSFDGMLAANVEALLHAAAP